MNKNINNDNHNDNHNNTNTNNRNMYNNSYNVNSKRINNMLTNECYPCVLFVHMNTRIKHNVYNVNHHRVYK